MADLGGSTAVQSRRGQLTDPGVRSLTVLLVLMIALPSQLIFSPLGATGTPAGVMGLILLGGWLLTRVADPTMMRLRQPVLVAMLIFVAANVASYVAAATRPIDTLEVSAADRGMLGLLGWLGMMLAASEGPRSLAELDVLLRRLSIAGGALAALGVLQFVTGQSFTNFIQVPGLSVNSELVSVLNRGGHPRPAGTAIHPIEFGAVLTLILPIALHYALSDEHRSKFIRWFPPTAIAFAVPISISRSAILSAVVVLVCLLPTWVVSQRRRAYGALVVLVTVVYLTIPGLLGTVRGLFTGISADSSAQSRTDSYSIATDFIKAKPIFGRGFRTFLPSYRILDNQYLLQLIETGIVGLTALLALFVTAIVTARRVRRSSTDPQVRSLAQALAAGVAASLCSFALYDAFSFPMASGLLFVVLGCVGSLYRLTRASA